VEGTNRVFGVKEFLIKEADQVPIGRIITVKKGNNPQLIEVSFEKLKTLIRNENAGYQIARDLADLQHWLGNLQQDKNAKLGEQERQKREYTKIYAWAGKILTNEFKQKRYPWLEKLASMVESSLYFTMGMAYLKQDETHNLEIETKTLDEFSKQFPPGSIVCEQGAGGDEMFILNSGKLSIEMNGVQVATVGDSGAVIGELALLLGQPRGATVKAIQPTTLSVIKKQDMPSVIKAQPDFLRNISLTLTRRVISSIQKITDLSKAITEQTKDDVDKPEVLKENPVRTSIKELQKEVKNLYERHDMEFLDDIYLEIGRRMNAVRKS